MLSGSQQKGQYRVVGSFYFKNQVVFGVPRLKLFKPVQAVGEALPKKDKLHKYHRGTR